ncbi:MAG: site-specific integrase [Actinomycetota bacterium]|nr:site-specific integrase [Actinomycetota bacterium]
MRGSVVKRGDTWSYVVDVGRDPVSGRRRQRWKGGFATKREAEKALGRALAAAGAGEVADAGGLTVGAYFDQWLAGHAPSLKPSTAKSYHEVVQWYVQPRLGRVKLVDLNALLISSLYADLLASGGRRRRVELSPATVAVVHRVLRKALNDAVLWGLLVRSPLLGVKPPRRNAPEMRAWTPDEARHFLRVVEADRLYGLWVLVLASGMRRGELAGLRWDDVDLDAGVLAVRRSRVRVSYAVHESDPKTRSSRRTISLDALVIGVLRAYRRCQLEERLAWGAAWTDTGYVFTSEDGLPLHPERITVLFGRLVASPGLPKVRLHDLRHTSASLMLAAGVHPKIVSERLGHSSVSITLDLYSHVIPGLQAEAAEKLGAMILGDR